MHDNIQASSILDDLLIDRFIEGEDDDYNSVREMKQGL
jgi:hypothetical protein